MRSCLLPRHSGLVRTCLLLLLTWAATGTVSAQIIDTPNSLYRIAGSALNEPGNQDGVGSRAGFKNPSGVVKRNDQLWVVDKSNSLIRRIQPDGRVETAFGFSRCGVQGGTKESARFCAPVGIALDSKGFLYVTDSIYSSVRQILGETIGTVAGMDNQCGMWYSVARSSLCDPAGIVADADDNLYVAEEIGLIRKIILSTGEVKTIAGEGRAGCGSVDGSGGAARFCFPSGLAIDRASGNLYVADTGNDTIRKVTPEGMVTTIAGIARKCGATDGPAKTTTFCSPRGIAVDAAGNLYVADTRNSLIRKITPDGLVSTVAGKANTNQTNLGSLPGTIARPTAIAVIGDGRLAITTEANEVLGINF